MPVYLRDAVTPLADGFAKVDQLEKPVAKALQGVFHRGRKEEGKAFFDAGGANCVQCHSAGPVKSQGRPGIDLATSPARLEKRFFEQIVIDPQSLQPGSPMVSPFKEGDDAEAVESLWQWLKSLSNQ